MSPTIRRFFPTAATWNHLEHAFPTEVEINGIQWNPKTRDRLDNTVETIIGGSGNDDMGASDFSNLGVDYPLPHLRFEGRGGNDLLSSAAELTADLIGGAGDDHFIIDESSSGSYEGGDGNDLFDLNNFALVTGINGGATASASIAFVRGDVDATRSVTASDILRAKGYVGQATGGGNFLNDVDLDGSITNTDVTAVQGNSGSQI